MRVAELLNDFRSLQYHITTLQASPSRAEEYYLEGYSWLRHAIAEAQTVLTQEYTNDQQHPRGNVEIEKSLLKLYATFPCFPVSPVFTNLSLKLRIYWAFVLISR
jgi:hypothetical protein